MSREQKPSKANDPCRSEQEGRTALIEQRIMESTDFDSASDLIKDNSTQKSVHDYFAQLLKSHNLTAAEAISKADLDKDYGVHIITGKRGTRRDNYIRLAIAIGLDFTETQSMLKFVRTGQIYALRQRDAAIMFCIHRKYGLMETQLMLDEHGFEPLGDGEFHTDGEVPLKDAAHSVDTEQVEQLVKSASSFSEVLEKMDGKLIKGDIEQYFDSFLQSRGMQKKYLFEVAGINPNIGYQLLRGLRRSKNRDVYLRIAIVMGLGIEETQRMLKLLNVGAIYPVVERDYAIYYGISRGYGLERMQEWLCEHGFLPL